MSAATCGRSDPEVLDRLLTTNVNGVVRTVREILPHLLERGEGDILVISSVSGHQAIHGAGLLRVQARAPGLRPHHAPAADRHRRALGAIAPGVVLNDLWGVSDPAEIEAKVARGEGTRSEDVADAAAYMLTRPRP